MNTLIFASLLIKLNYILLPFFLIAYDQSDYNQQNGIHCTHYILQLLAFIMLYQQYEYRITHASSLQCPLCHCIMLNVPLVYKAGQVRFAIQNLFTFIIIILYRINKIYTTIINKAQSIFVYANQGCQLTPFICKKKNIHTSIRMSLKYFLMYLMADILWLNKTKITIKIFWFKGRFLFN